MLKVAIIGASGYTGLELMRLSVQHPDIELIAVTSEKFSGMKVSEVFPSLAEQVSLVFQSIADKKDINKADFIFSALPHKEAMSIVPALLENSTKIVDLSADFRLQNPALYEKWYQKHTAPELLQDAVYGLSELYREKIKNAQLVANPGCYPTAVLLSLIPVIKNGIIDINSIIVDAKSGISGSGRSVALSSLYSEVNEGVKAYKVTAHQHTPEMEQELGKLAEKEVQISFTPHLIPMNRGILATVYASLSQKISEEEIVDIYRQYYENDIFVTICPRGIFPSTNQVKGSNYCAIGVAIDEVTNRLIVVSVIDNLLKGGAGQAMQNMNIMASFSEGSGLGQLSLFP